MATALFCPHDIHSRYFTEDAPYGLVPWSHLGKAVGVATPVIDSVVTIYNVLHERDMQAIPRVSFRRARQRVDLSEPISYELP